MTTEAVVLFIAWVITMISNIILFTMLNKKRRCFGKLVIDMTNPEKDIYRIEMDDLQDLEREKYVLLKIRVEEDAQK